MTSAYWLQLCIAFVLMILAGLIAAAEAALSSFSKARADRLVEDGRPGAQRVRKIVEDPPRYLNTALFLRSMIEISAIILVANVIFSLIPKTWQAGAVTAGIMIIVSYIAWEWRPVRWAVSTRTASLAVPQDRSWLSPPSSGHFRGC